MHIIEAVNERETYVAVRTDDFLTFFNDKMKLKFLMMFCSFCLKSNSSDKKNMFGMNITFYREEGFVTSGQESYIKQKSKCK